MTQHRKTGNREPSGPPGESLGPGDPPGSWGSGRDRFLGNSALHALLLILVCLIAYSNTFHVPFQFDDFHNIEEKHYVRDIRLFFESRDGNRVPSDHGFRMRTFGYLTFALNYWIGGRDVFGFHVVNLLIHCINGLLLYWFVVLCFRGPVLGTSSLRDASKAIALFSSLLFVSHPVQTQAVTYIVQRITSLATCFYLLSLASYVKSRIVSAEGFPARKVFPWYGVSIVSAILAMKTKEIAFTLPLAVALCEFLFFRGEVRKRILLLAPMLLTMGIIPLGLIGTPGSAGELIGDVSRSMRVDSPLSRWEYLFTEMRVVVTYLRLLVLPVGQNLDYDYPVFRSFLDHEVILSFLFLAVLAGTGIQLALQDRKSNTGLRLVSFGIFWFFLALSVESSIIPITDVIYEHRLYLPSAGFWIAVTTALFLGARRVGNGSFRLVFLSVLAVIVLLFSGSTHARNRVWQSEVSLWEDVVRKSPGKARGYNSLGFALRKEGRLVEAIGHYQKAIELEPQYALARNNLGYAFYLSRDFGRAVQQYEHAIRLQPDFAEAHNGLGIVHAETGSMDKAAERYLTAIRLKPDFANAHTNLGTLYYRRGDVGGAIWQYETAIRIRPDIAEPYNNLGVLYAGMGFLDRAVHYFGTAVSLDPGNPEYRRNWKNASGARTGR